ncbi:hypothetical protein ACFFX0_16765 [Citricoccus parietis]|uniref:Uncharacterized protein n=1 Tax=Citricoccus parietis TaxID=592307 RepID=A0ABV5G1I2_9MICC
MDWSRGSASRSRTDRDPAWPERTSAAWDRTSARRCRSRVSAANCWRSASSRSAVRAFRGGEVRSRSATRDCSVRARSRVSSRTRFQSFCNLACRCRSCWDPATSTRSCRVSSSRTARASRSWASPKARYLARSSRRRPIQRYMTRMAMNIGSAARGAHSSGVRMPESNFRSAAVRAAPMIAWGPWPRVLLLTKVSRMVAAVE